MKDWSPPPFFKFFKPSLERSLMTGKWSNNTKIMINIRMIKLLLLLTDWSPIEIAFLHSDPFDGTFHEVFLGRRITGKWPYDSRKLCSQKSISTQPSSRPSILSISESRAHLRREGLRTSHDLRDRSSGAKRNLKWRLLLLQVPTVL